METEEVDPIVWVDGVCPVCVERPASGAAVEVVQPQRQAGAHLYGRKLLVEIIQIRFEVINPTVELTTKLVGDLLQMRSPFVNLVGRGFLRFVPCHGRPPALVR